MALSFSADGILRLLLDRGREQRVRTAEYLDALASDAVELARMWNEILVHSVDHEDQDEDPRDYEQRLRALKVFRRTYSASQVISAERISLAYERATLSVGGEVTRILQDSLMEHLAHLLIHRETARRVMEEKGLFALLSRERDLRVFDPRNASLELNDLESVVEAMHREAAALQMLAREYRSRSA